MSWRHRIIVILGLFVYFLALQARAEPRNIYVLWNQERANTTLSIVFHTEKSVREAEVLLGKKECLGSLRCYSQKIETQGVLFKWGNRNVHQASLKELKPNQSYFFVVGSRKHGFSKEKTFQTLPSSGPLRFVSGGDLGIRKQTFQLLENASKLRPDFAIFGGDLAYGNARKGSAKRWDLFFAMLEKTLFQNRLIPIVAAVGNHETKRAKPEPRAPYYSAYFPQDPEHRTYFKRNLRNDVVLYILDSGQVSKHDGDQLSWLRSNLEEDHKKTWKIAAYHIPLFPSFRPFKGVQSQRGREHWLPLFEKHGLDIAFENHDHTLKRTRPIRDGKPAEEGVIFLGDGAFGEGSRKPNPKRLYLAFAKKAYHFWYGELDEKELRLKAIGLDGKPLDRVVLRK